MEESGGPHWHPSTMAYTIIGTSHIARQSIQEISKAIEEGRPDIVALELDSQRATALLRGGSRNIPLSILPKIGLKGFLFAKIGQIVQQKLGKVVGVNPGAEMKTALELARKNKLQIALIDQPITITLKNLSQACTWKEKLHFVRDIIKGIFWRKQQIKELGLDKIDFHKVPEQELIGKIISQLKSSYPSLYKVLVDDRNKYMVKGIIKLFRQHPGKKVLIIVGAGHKEGMEKLLLKVDVV